LNTWSKPYTRSTFTLQSNFTVVGVVLTRPKKLECRVGVSPQEGAWHSKKFHRRRHYNLMYLSVESGAIPDRALTQGLHATRPARLRRLVTCPHDSLRPFSRNILPQTSQPSPRVPSDSAHLLKGRASTYCYSPVNPFYYASTKAVPQLSHDSR
jgi:hypothetical protein